MAKKLRTDQEIFLAPNIRGWIDDNYAEVVVDDITGENLVAWDSNDKVTIYKRQVEGWFLNPASALVEVENNGFVVLMICLSYIEGVEQYRRGESSLNRSTRFFVDSLNRIFPNTYNEQDLRDLYSEARCGLFHNGMVEGRILIGNHLEMALTFEGADIKVNPRLLLEILKNDFANFIQELRSDGDARDRFATMFSNL